MENLTFYKMSGSGNDFILIDGRRWDLSKFNLSELARKLCHRTFGIGADGLIVLDKSNRADFKWHFFNADGSEAEMCGNGGRCAARLAYLLGMCEKKLSFETKAGVIRAEVDGSKVKLELTPPFDLKLNLNLQIDDKEYLLHFINTGVPHAVFVVEDLENIPIKELGRKVRFHEYFKPAGTNVNFIKVLKHDYIKIRTYERGVEDETLACGTGSVAGAVIAYKLGKVKPPVKLETKSGEILEIFFDEELKEVFLKGETRLICKGEVLEEVFN